MSDQPTNDNLEPDDSWERFVAQDEQNAAQAAAAAQTPYEQQYGTSVQTGEVSGSAQGESRASVGQSAPEGSSQTPTTVQVQAYYVNDPRPLTYPMSDTDRTLRLIAFIFNIISMLGSAMLIIPLIWMIPMCVVSWGIYKGTRANTTAFGVCDLIFCSLVGGILLLCTKKDR